MHVVFAIPSYRGLLATGGSPDFARSLADTLERCTAEGYRVTVLTKRGCYIQTMRNELVSEFLQTDGDALFFLDDDVSWGVEAVMRLLVMPDLIVAGLYRMKCRPVQYTGVVHTDADDRAIVRRSDGAIAAARVPTGFLRIHREALEQMTTTYADRAYSIMHDGERIYDLFPQGLFHGAWVGEDFAFCQLWTAMMGQLWVVPDLDLTHHDLATGQSFPGNFHQFLMRQPGGCHASQ